MYGGNRCANRIFPSLYVVHTDNIEKYISHLMCYRVLTLFMVRPLTVAVVDPV